jgi:hypothetical protein
MAKRNNVAAVCMQAIVAVFFMVLGLGMTSCSKDPVDNHVDPAAYEIKAKKGSENYSFKSYAITDGAQLDGTWTQTSPADSAKASAYLKAAVKLAKEEIEINSSLKTNNVWSFDSISAPVATADGYRWNGYMSKNDGQKATFPISSTTAGLRDLVIGLEPVGLRADSTKNNAATPRSGEKDRMTTVEYFTVTVRESGTGRSNTVDIPLQASYLRFIPEGAPEIVDSIIVWKDGEGIRSFHNVLASTEKARIQVVYLLSDGSRTDGPAYSIEVPRQLWGSEDKMYVSKFEETIGTSFSGQSVVEPEAKSDEYSNENFTVSYETTKKSWEHTQLDVNGNKARTALFSKLPHIVFNHGALSHDFGKLPLDVANTSVEVVEKSPVVEDGKNYDVKQLRNTIDTNYGVDSTGIVAQQVISTVDLLKLNADVTLIDVTAVMSRSWSATQGTFTWKLTEHYSNNTTKDTTIVWSSSRSIEANNFDKEDVKKALSEGSVKTEVAHSDVKSVVNPSYTIRYKVATATYSWLNTFVTENATSVVTSSLPEKVSLEYKGYKFNQPADEISYTKEAGSLTESYNDGSKKIYDYKANFFESVKGYDNSAAKAIATGKLTVNAAVPTSWELLSKVNDYVLFNHTVGAKYRVNYSDGSHQEFEFNKTINGESASTAVETTEDEVSEVVGAPSDYVLRKENKQDGDISFALWTTKVTENAERTRGNQEYGYTYSIGREVKYVRTFGDVKVEIDFEDPTISYDVERTDFVQTGEEETADATKYTWQRQNNLIVNINGANNTINNKGIIYIYGGHGGGEPEAPKAVIGGGIVSPKPGLSDSMWFVGYLIELNNGKVRPLIVDKNGQNITLGDEFDKDDRWNGAAYIDGKLYPVLGSNTGSMLKYTYAKGVSYAISAVNAGDGFNWNNATVNNVTKHYTPIIKKEGAKTILTLDGVAGWSMEF